MPPLKGSFPVSSDAEVVCPLKNHDGTSCRKRCTGEKRFRSMQEHIRRAHPEHYISKLPATEESFILMVTTPPSERPPPPPPPPQPSTSVAPSSGYVNDSKASYDEFAAHASRKSDELRRGSLLPAASAAAALAALHNHRPEAEWDSEPDAYSDTDGKGPRKARFAASNSLEQAIAIEDQYYASGARPRELLPSSMARSPPGRSSTLPPAPRSVKPNRPRKSSVTQNARKPKHERTKSKDHERRQSYDRKALSAEPSGIAAFYGKRWEDLIDAAASATEEDSRDLTPVPTSPRLPNRASLPPYIATQYQSYQASPLQRTLTPPPPESSDMHAFPSVESSLDSTGSHFHIPSHGLSDSSPTNPLPVQIYCAACRRLSVLRDSYACTECICGLCPECVDVLVKELNRGRIAACPKCGAVGGKFKPFQLDIR